MSQSYPISPPSNYVAAVAIGYADSANCLALIGHDRPLPVISARTAAPAPLVGETSQSIIAGPFEPITDTPIHVELRGEWAGRIELQRSTDGGATRSPLTAGGMPWARYTGNVNEAAWHEGERSATFYLAIELVSGAVSYRISQ